MFVIGRETGGVFREKRYLVLDSLDEYALEKNKDEATIFETKEEAEHIVKSLKHKEYLEIYYI